MPNSMGPSLTTAAPPCPAQILSHSSPTQTPTTPGFTNFWSHFVLHHSSLISAPLNTDPLLFPPTTSPVFSTCHCPGDLPWLWRPTQLLEIASTASTMSSQIYHFDDIHSSEIISQEFLKRASLPSDAHCWPTKRPKQTKITIFFCSRLYLLLCITIRSEEAQ